MLLVCNCRMSSLFITGERRLHGVIHIVQDIYVFHIDKVKHVFDGAHAFGVEFDESVDLDYVFPVWNYATNWVPHWQPMNEWKGERFIGDTIPIPRKPHEFSELLYPNHMVSDNNNSVLTCTLSN